MMRVKPGMAGLRKKGMDEPLSKQGALALARRIYEGSGRLEEKESRLRDIYVYEGGDTTKRELMAEAVREGESEAVDRLIAHYGVDPSGKDDEDEYIGASFLVCALISGHLETAKALIDRGADVESAIKELKASESTMEKELYHTGMRLVKELLLGMKGRKWEKISETYLPEIPEPDERERRVLTALAMNGLISGKLLCKAASLGPKVAAKGMRDTARKFRLRYTAELDINKLGYLSYIAMVKFDVRDDEEPPSAEELKVAVEKQPMVQLAMTTRGDYDLVMFLLARNDDELRSDIYKLRSAMAPEQRSYWNIAPFFTTYGFIPIRDRFFDMLKERVWRPAKGQRTPNEDQMFRREWAVLREVCADGSINMSEVDKKYDFDKGRAGYTLGQLTAKGVIKRITAIEELPIHSDILLVANVNQTEWEGGRAQILNDIIEGSERPTSKYVIVGDITLPGGGLYVIPSYKYDYLGERSGIEETAESFGERFEGAEVKALEIEKVLIGRLPYRLFDPGHTNQYKILVDEYNEKRVEKIDYGNMEKPASRRGLRNEIIHEEIDLT